MSVILFLFILAFNFARADEPIDQAGLAAIAEFERLEASFDVVDGHAARVRLHRDDAGRPLRAAHTTLIISGLFKSPRATAALEDLFFARGDNVINLRLAGHFETDRTSIRSEVTWEMWRAQARAAFELAAQLGDRVRLVGHSTGAVLVTWLALEHPAEVAGLAIFAPAFGLSGGMKRLLAGEGQLLVPYPRVRTLHAGREARQLGRAFRAALMRETGAPGFTGARGRLDLIPVWMANTEIDAVINLSMAGDFFNAITGASSVRRHHWLPWFSLVVHDQIAEPLPKPLPAGFWPGLTDSMCETLFES